MNHFFLSKRLRRFFVKIKVSSSKVTEQLEILLILSHGGYPEYYVKGKWGV